MASVFSGNRSEETIATIQDCFRTTYFQMFCIAADGNIDQYTDSVSAHISKCVDDVIPKVHNLPHLKAPLD